MPRGANGRSTLKDVAEAVGVSIASVSKVLNGRGDNVRVSFDTAEAIRAAARELRYSPNHLASALRMSQTHTVGLIWERMHGIAGGPLYYMYLLDGVSRVLFDKHYRLTILPELTDDPVRNIGDGRIDGAIWCKMPSDPVLIEDLAHSGFQVVALNSPPAPNGEYVSVTCDNEGGVELVVDHLFNLGHRRMAIALDEGWETAPDAHERLQGFQRALAKRDIVLTSADVLTWPVNNPPLIEWLAQDPPHTAIFAWQDSVAGGILAAALNAGISVPERLSVVGFDSTMYCESTTQ